MGAIKGKEKTPTHVVAHRINTLFKAIISGVVLDAFKLREIAVINKWDVSERSLTSYRKKAQEKFQEHADINIKEEIGIAKARYQFLYNQCVMNKQYKVAVSAQKEICVLLGLNSPNKHEVTGKDGQSLLEGLSTDDILNMM